jgi:hypothetical protein
VNSIVNDPFEAMIREAGEGWLLDWHAPPGAALAHLRELLRKADDTARARLGAGAPKLTPDALTQVYAQNPHKVRAFLQVAATASTPDILVMVWRVLEGVEIAGIDMKYDAHGPFHLRVSLFPSSAVCRVEDYESTDIDDAVVLRHLGTFKLGNQGTFDGFYAMNRGKK